MTVNDRINARSNTMASFRDAEIAKVDKKLQQDEFFSSFYGNEKEIIENENLG
jgi:hypothetical protein